MQKAGEVIKNREPVKFAFYVSGNASRLIELFKRSSAILEDTALILNDNGPNTKLATFTSKKNIHYIEFNYADAGVKEADASDYLSGLMLNAFNKHTIGYCYCFGGKILKGDLLNAYKNKIINFHPSLLPAFPGINAIDQALNKPAFLMGNSAHFIDAGVDTGPVIMQSILHHSAYIDYENILDLQLPMIEQIHQWITEKRIAVVNNKVVIQNATYPDALFYPQLEQ